MDDGGRLRRSLRRINPFKNNLFRLPATPRLARSKKVGGGEDVVTDWNFERASTRSSNSRRDEPLSPDTVSLPIPRECPPEPKEAESSIHEHMRQLLPASNHLLPSTRYTKDGQMREAIWPSESIYDETSPNNSTLSLLSSQRHFKRPINGAMSRASLRTSYPLNGISRPPSTEPRLEHKIANGYSSIIRPLYTLKSQASPSQLEETFIAREWVFREIYQSAVVEKVPLTVIEGQRGAGKSTIFNQLVLNSPFYTHASDTIDSGCVVESLPSRNYEWLRAVAGRVVAYHTCTIQNASTCHIPEFVCNIGAMLANSTILKSYSVILEKKPELLKLLRLEECLKQESLEVFKKAIAEPLSQLKSTDQGSLVLLVDGVDEADFHRSEDGRSIADFLVKVIPLLPSWLRVIITADLSSTEPMQQISPRTVRIDDGELDERVVRDNRMFVEYKMSMLREVEDTVHSLRRLSLLDPLSQLSQRLVTASGGNTLYLKLLLQLVETGKMNISSLTHCHLPKDLFDLYTLWMDLTYTSPVAFHAVCPVLDVLLASGRALDRGSILAILNSGGPSSACMESELNESLIILSPLLSISSDQQFSLHHPAFREWLLDDHQQKYKADARKGHLLLALWLSEQAPLSPSQLMEMAHHLLKAHAYKYMPGQFVPELTSAKEGPILWIQKSTDNIAGALMDHRNMFYPNTKVSRLLLVAGADPSYSPSPASSLCVSQLAVSAGHWSLVQLLLHFGAGLHPDEGPSLLATAARYGHLHLIKQLLPLDLHPDLSTALIEAAAHSHIQVISSLLNSSWPSTESKESAVEEALCAAAAKGQTAVCKLFVDSYGSVDIDRAMRSACEAGQAESVQFFLSRGASLASISWPDSRPALHCAVESGSWDLVVAVLSLPDTVVDRKDFTGRTPLICAAKQGHVGLVDMLFNKGADVNARDDKGWSGLMHAVHEGHLPCVQLLLDRNADVNIIDSDGNSLAHVACGQAPRAIIDRLIEGGMNFEEKDKDGNRAIEVAIRNRNRPALDALLRRGARLRSTTWQTARDNDQDTVLVLLSKLLDDAAILFRKKRLEDAMHRLSYATEKCNTFLADPALSLIHGKLSRMKVQVLLASARVLRREGRLHDAIEACQQAAQAADSEDSLFDVLLLRAKCRFDCHDVERARSDAKAASQLRPGCEEARHLLNTLQQPVNIARL